MRENFFINGEVSEMLMAIKCQLGGSIAVYNLEIVKLGLGTNFIQIFIKIHQSVENSIIQIDK